MEANRTRHRWTYSEYARLPLPSEAGGTRYEVIHGELFVAPSPGRRHQEIVTHVVWLLYGFVRATGVGELFVSPFDVLFGEGDYLEPDIVFVRADRSELVTERGVEGPPDLLVEVISPWTGTRDRGIKLERYRLYGVAEYWVVDPAERTVEVWSLEENATEPRILRPADTLRWTPEPGGSTLEIALAELFSDVRGRVVYPGDLLEPTTEEWTEK